MEAKRGVGRRKGIVKKMLILYYGIRDSRTPWYAKLTALAAAIYLISPVDIIPDFIPVAGYLDDLIVTPLLLGIASGLLPADVQNTAEKKAASKHKALVWVIIGLLVVIALLLVWLVHSWHR